MDWLRLSSLSLAQCRSATVSSPVSPVVSADFTSTTPSTVSTGASVIAPNKCSLGDELGSRIRSTCPLCFPLASKISPLGYSIAEGRFRIRKFEVRASLAEPRFVLFNASPMNESSKASRRSRVVARCLKKRFVICSVPQTPPNNRQDDPPKHEMRHCHHPTGPTLGLMRRARAAED